MSLSASEVANMTRICLAWLAIGLLAFSACSSDEPEIANDINVILVLPLTGAFQARGELHKTAMQMAFADLTAQGDLIDGRPLRVWLVDSTSDSAQAEQRLRDFIDQQLSDGDTKYVSAIISSSEPAQIGSLPVALELEIPHFEVSSGTRWDLFVDAADARAHKYAFVAQAVGHAEAIYAADYINTIDVWERLVIMRGTSPADRLHAELVRTRLNQLGWNGTIVNPSDIVMDYDGVPWRDHLQSVIDDNVIPPSVVYFKLSGDRHVRDFLADAKLVDLFSDMVTSGTTRDEELLDAVNPGIVDFLDLKYSFAFRSPISTELGNASLEAFQADFQAFTDSDEYELWAPSAYDAAMVLGLGIIAAGSTDGETLADAVEQVSKGGTIFSYGQSAEAINALRQNMDINYDGASGSFDIRNDPIGGSQRDTARAVPGEVRINATSYTDGNSKGEYVSLPDPEPTVL